MAGAGVTGRAVAGASVACATAAGEALDAGVAVSALFLWWKIWSSPNAFPFFGAAGLGVGSGEG